MNYYFKILRVSPQYDEKGQLQRVTFTFQWTKRDGSTYDKIETYEPKNFAFIGLKEIPKTYHDRKVYEGKQTQLLSSMFDIR